jgi:hypothetical protein
LPYAGKAQLLELDQRMSPMEWFGCVVKLIEMLFSFWGLPQQAALFKTAAWVGNLEYLLELQVTAN